MQHNPTPSPESGSMIRPMRSVSVYSRGGPPSDSVELIREARRERSDQLNEQFVVIDASVVFTVPP